LFQFLARNGNIVAAVAPNASETLVAFAREFNLEFDLKSTSVIDHSFFDHEQDDGTHTLLRLPWRGSSVSYKGLAHYVPPIYPLAAPFLQGTPTSYSYEVGAVQVDADLEGSSGPVLSGSRAHLVTGVQTLENSRILWSGSLDVFSDAHWQINADFVDHVFKWAFQEEGVLRVEGVEHKRVGEQASRKEYRIRDNLVR
jgi:oligosaccharyltransferase complex subunit beta